MNKAAGPKLAAEVSNQGGLGVIGGVGFTPRILRLQLKHLKKDLKNKNLPFGVDIPIPKIGGTARKTNYDYTKGKPTGGARRPSDRAGEHSNSRRAVSELAAPWICQHRPQLLIRSGKLFGDGSDYTGSPRCSGGSEPGTPEEASARTPGRSARRILAGC